MQKAFRTLNEIDAIESIRVVYPFDHSSWCHWDVSEASAVMVQTAERPRSSGKAMKVNFEPGNSRSGFMTVSPRKTGLELAAETLAVSLWNAILLQSALDRVKKAAVSEAELVRATMRARDEERRRIARELHDDLGQSMASLKLGLKWAEDLARQKAMKGDLVKELADSREAVAGMMTRIRSLSHTLYPRILDTLGLFAAVKELAFQTGRHSGMEIQCAIKGKERTLAKEVGVALYRCCQESVNNAMRHAGASRLSIGLQYKKSEVCVTVEDNGQGFDPRTLYDSSGKMMSSGFWTIRQRLSDLGGSFRLSTGKGRGTNLEITVPYR